MCAPSGDAGVLAGHHGGKHLSGLDRFRVRGRCGVRVQRSHRRTLHGERRSRATHGARRGARRRKHERSVNRLLIIGRRSKIGGVIVHENRFAGVNPGARAVCGFSRGFSAVCSPAAAWRRPRAPPRGGTGGARAAAAPPVWGRCAPAHAAFAIPHGLVALRKLNRTVL